MGGTTLLILARDPDFVAIAKPSGFHVHQPERPRPRVAPELTCLTLLRRQIGQRVHPVHRLDVATSGVLLFALGRESASALGRAFSQGASIEKNYYAIVRGHPPDEGVIDVPLMSDSSDQMLESRTRFACLARAELPHLVGKRAQPARFSIVRAEPETGRFHQIRRHFARKAHPLVGDSSHGDLYQNRFFRDTLGVRGLLLHARALSFPHPRTGETVNVEAPWSEAWIRATTALGFAPDGSRLL